MNLAMLASPPSAARRLRALVSGAVLCALSLGALACGPAQAPAIDASLELPSSDRRVHSLGAEFQRHALTVLVFYSESCPCMEVHQPRLAELVRDFGPRDVQFYLVNSEPPADATRDAQLAEELPAPLLTDEGARLAKQLGAEFATHSVIVDRSGQVRYSGGFDSDKNHLRQDVTPHLKIAIERLLAGQAPERSPEALGCPLQR